MPTYPDPCRRRLCLAVTLSVLGAASSRAATPPIQIEGQTFQGELWLAGQVLQCNGVGLRAVAWFKGYAAALYLRDRARTTPQVLATPGAKRLQMRMLVDVDTEEFIKAFHKGVARNTPVAGQPALEARMARFDELLHAVGKVKRRDVIDLDWLPGRGMQLGLNGQLRGEPIPGDDFYAALLLIFIGEKPVDAELKIGLLGGPAS
jgi:hypothetical protein